MDSKEFTEAINSKMEERTEEVVEKLLQEITTAFIEKDVKVTKYDCVLVLDNIYGGNIYLDVWPWMIKNLNAKLPHCHISSMKFQDGDSNNVQITLEVNPEYLLNIDPNDLKAPETVIRKFLEKKKEIIQEIINKVIAKVKNGEFSVVGSTTEDSFRSITISIEKKSEYGDAELREAMRALYAFYSQKRFSYSIKDDHINITTDQYV
jgi:hypothetical protein